MTIEATVLQDSKLSTTMALLMAIVVVVPGYFVGSLAAFVYSWFANYGFDRFGGGGSWIPFLDGVIAVLWFMVLPDAIRAGVATYLALVSSLWLFKKAKAETVVYSTAAVWIILILIFSGIATISMGPDIRLFGMAGMVAGVVVGAVFYGSSRSL